jgi:8-oxo-dGTP pyrophosphatase MutT (NUDIX family)
VSLLPLRDTARALVLDPQDRLLLIAYEAARDVDQARPGLRRFWFTPGGGLEPGESHEAALARELAEEIGVSGLAIGPWVARREVDLTLFRRPTFTRERYFPVRLASSWFDSAGLAETESDPVLDIRWWAIEDLETTEEVVVPRGLIALAARIIAGNPPPEPVVLP